MLRFGLCCLYLQEPVRFRTTTATALRKLPRDGQLQKLSSICLSNAENLLLALRTAKRMRIGAFRILSGFLPRCTHPDVAYSIYDLPEGRRILSILEEVRLFARENDLRLSFHPDQFITLSSPRPEVVENSIRELEYQGRLAELVAADTITLHGGGAGEGKTAALSLFRRNFGRLSSAVRARLALENDERTYTPQDLLPVCRDLDIPLVYDVHHHRCNPDGISIPSATELAAASWEKGGREPYFHISSPRSGWGGGNPRPHADFIDPADFPACWRNLSATVDVEAKAKELAVVRLMDTVLRKWPGGADRGRGAVAEIPEGIRRS